MNKAVHYNSIYHFQKLGSNLNLRKQGLVICIKVLAYRQAIMFLIK